MREVKACRGCLMIGDRLVKIPDTWYRMVETLTGLQISKTDGYPNYFCLECKSHIQKAIAFRKRTRRAFFILKEIMMVRKEVNLQDILTVDRSKVSLESPLGLFRPNRSAVYSVCSSELIKEDLNMVNNNAVIDIKGEMGEFPEEVPEEPIDDDHSADQGDNIPIDDDEEKAQDLDTEQKEPEPEVEPEIDMNDIFKGLKEPESENSDDEVQTKKKKMKEKKKKKVKKKQKKKEKEVVIKNEVSDYSLTVKARTLVNYDIKKLTDDEQKEVFKKRIEHPYFSKALYRCGLCIKVMPSVPALMEHFDRHKDKITGQFLCKICKDKFMTREEYDMHCREQHMYQYTCKICNDVVYSIRDMVKHKKEKHVTKYEHKEESEAIATLTVIDYEAELNDKFLLIPLSEEDKVNFFKKSKGEGFYTCGVCGMGFPLATHGRRHWLMHQKEEEDFLGSPRCLVCGVWCSKPESLDQHMESFHNYNYHCKLCSYEASNRYLAVYHLTRAHREINACHICGVTSRTPTGLDKHIMLQHGKLFRRHHCSVCGAAYRAQSSLYVHQFKEHGFFILPEAPIDGADNACLHCNIQFLSTKAYHNHLVKLEHDEAKDLPWKCLPCRKLFDSEEEYKSHTEQKCKHRKPPPIFPIPCRMCGETFQSYASLYFHCEKRHPGHFVSKSFKKLCYVCGKIYRRNAHPPHGCLLKYAGRYKCSACEVVFHWPVTLVYHVLKKHMRKPFSCNICAKKFKRRYDCKDHIMKVHAPVRPYVCPVCERPFAHIDFLKEHAKDTHDVQVELELKTPRKKNQFFLYPNMKVDLSLIDVNIIHEVKIQVADYTDQIFEVLQDYTDYVITSEDIRQKKEEGPDLKEFLISKNDRRDPENSSPKTSSTKKISKKEMYRQFVFGDDTEYEVKQSKQANVTSDDQDEESEAIHRQSNEYIITKDEGDEASDANQQSNEFVIANYYVDEESITTQLKQEYMISEEIEIEQEQSLRKKTKTDHREFLIRSADVKRRREQYGASPRKKIKYNNFEQ